jgi:hypothetical protein
MITPAKKIDGPKDFNRFEQLTKRLLTIRHEDLLAKLAEFKRRKVKAKAG